MSTNIGNQGSPMTPPYWKRFLGKQVRRQVYTTRCSNNLGKDPIQILILDFLEKIPGKTGRTACLQIPPGLLATLAQCSKNLGKDPIQILILDFLEKIL